MKPKLVLIIAHQCHPFNRPESVIGAQRPYQFARNLPSTGWKCLVLCCNSSNLPKNQTGKGIRLLPQLALALDELNEQGWSIIGINPNKPSLLQKAWSALSVPVRQKNKFYQILRKTISLYNIFTGDFSYPWIKPAKKALDQVISRVSFDMIIAEHSPDAGIRLARYANKKYGIKWISDFRDPWMIFIPQNIRLVFKYWSRFYLKSCSSIIQVTQEWSEKDQIIYRKPAYCIPNGFAKEDFADLPVKPVAMNNPFIINYSGSIKFGQNIEIFLDGLKAVHQSLLDSNKSIAFHYQGPQFEFIHSTARIKGILDICDIQPQVPRKTALLNMRNADCLLLLSTDSGLCKDPLLKKGFYPAKVFEYIGSGSRILLVPGDYGSLETLLKNSPQSRLARNALDIEKNLLDAIHQRWMIDSNKIETFSLSFTRKKMTENLARILNKTLEVKD